MSIQVNDKNLGHATAYAYAVAGGYTGTEAEFTELLGNIADDLGQIENLTVTVETLAAGSSATASYSNGVLHLGIPKGDKGDKGDTGATGPTGPTGNGIASVAKTGTSGLVDTYTITYTNGNTSTFTVTNGAEAVDNTLTIAGRAADAKKTGDEISELKEDLTATNAEVTDIRVGADGTTYNSAGAAVRGQISDLNERIGDVKSALTTTKNLLFEIGTLSGGKAAESTKYARTAAFYEITKGAPIIFNSSTKLLRFAASFYNTADENDILLNTDVFDVPVNGSYTLIAPADCYFRFRVTWIPQSDITSDDLTLFAQLFSYYIPESYDRIKDLQAEITSETVINTAQQKQLDSAIPVIQMDGLEIGGITQGNNNTDNRYVRCATYYPVNKGETVQMKSSSEFQYNIAFYIYAQSGGDSTSLITSSIDYNVSKNGQDGSYVVPATGYLRFRAVAVPAATVTTERLNAFKALISYQKYNFLGAINDEIADKTRNYNLLSINHRGYSAAPENTLVAFKQSKIHGFNYVETDVRFTSDGVAVLLHDASINRTARNEDGTAISSTVNIADITYEQALTYDFGVYKGNEYVGTKIPTFEAFLSLCRNISLVPVIELKVGTREQVYALYDLAAQYGLKNKAIWLSQTFTYLAYIRDYSDATLVYCRSTYTTDTQYLKNDGNKVIVGLPSEGITAETVLACIAADYEIWQYTIEIASDISTNQYVTGYLTNTIDVGETLYNQAIT